MTWFSWFYVSCDKNLEMFLVFVCAKVFVTLFVIWLVELVKKHCGINEEISDYVFMLKKGLG